MLHCNHQRQVLHDLQVSPWLMLHASNGKKKKNIHDLQHKMRHLQIIRLCSCGAIPLYKN